MTPSRNHNKRHLCTGNTRTPELMLGWQRHHKLDSIGSAGCPSKCPHQHRLQQRYRADAPQLAVYHGKCQVLKPSVLTVGMKHGALEFDNRGFVWILLRELKRELKCACKKCKKLARYDTCAACCSGPKHTHKSTLRRAASQKGLACDW